MNEESKKRFVKSPNIRVSQSASQYQDGDIAEKWPGTQNTVSVV